MLFGRKKIAVFEFNIDNIMQILFLKFRSQGGVTMVNMLTMS